MSRHPRPHPQGASCGKSAIVEAARDWRALVRKNAPRFSPLYQHLFIASNYNRNWQMGLNLTLWDIVICCVALVGSVAAGLFIALRRGSAESSSEFFLAGRRLTWPVVGASLFATNIGAEHLVGLSGDAYRYGISAGTVELTTCICLGFACPVLFP